MAACLHLNFTRIRSEAESTDSCSVTHCQFWRNLCALELLGHQGAKRILYLLIHQLLLKGKSAFSGKDGWDGEYLVASDARGFPEGLSGKPQPSLARYEPPVASPTQLACACASDDSSIVLPAGAL